MKSTSITMFPFWETLVISKVPKWEHSDFLREPLVLQGISKIPLIDQLQTSKWHNFSTNDSMIDRLKVFPIANYLKNTLVPFKTSKNTKEKR